MGRETERQRVVNRSIVTVARACCGCGREWNAAVLTLFDAVKLCTLIRGACCSSDLCMRVARCLSVTVSSQSVNGRHCSFVKKKQKSNLFNGRCPGLPGWAGTRKVQPIWILLKQETVSGSGIIWAVCKSAPRCRQITAPAPHHFFTGRIPFLPPNQQRQSTEGHVALQLYHSNNFSCLPQRSVEWTNSGNVTVQMHCVLHELALIGFQSDSFQWLLTWGPIYR